jgi:hypothetical protein
VRRRTRLKIGEGGRERKADRPGDAHGAPIINPAGKGVLFGPEPKRAGEMAHDTVRTGVVCTILDGVGDTVRRSVVRNNHRRRAWVAVVRGIAVQQEVQRRPGRSQDEEDSRRQAPRPHAEQPEH